MTRGMYVYPRGLKDERAAAVLPSLRDKGIDAISLAVGTHAGKFVRPHRDPSSGSTRPGRPDSRSTIMDT